MPDIASGPLFLIVTSSPVDLYSINLTNLFCIHLYFWPLQYPMAMNPWAELCCVLERSFFFFYFEPGSQ